MKQVSEMKQVIILRKDLNMRKGKMVAQGAHASMAAVLKHMNDKRVKEWLAGPFAKIVVSVDSEEELIEIFRKANNDKLITSLITDAGRTEFHGVATKTAVAVGPDKPELIDKITGHLKLL